MLSDVRNYYGLTKDFGQVGYYETGQSQQIVKELSHEIRAGKLVTLSGIVGSGKTTMLRRIQETLAQEKEILVSKSLSVDKGQLSLPVLINALFYDLATEKDFKKIVVEHLGVDEAKVTPEASFIDDLGADSLDTVELVMAFEEALSVEIPEDAAEKIATVKDAIDYIEKQNK